MKLKLQINNFKRDETLKYFICSAMLKHFKMSLKDSDIIKLTIQQGAVN